MKLTDKNIWKYKGIILLCCIIAMLLHPLSFMEITWLIEGSVIPTYLCSYLLGSIIAWLFYKGNSWWKLALLTFFSINILFTCLMQIEVYDCGDAMTWLMFTTMNIFNTLLSAVLICGCCYYIQKRYNIWN